MGFSVSGSAAVVLIGVVVAVGVAIPPVIASFGELTESQGQQVDRGVETLNTDFEVAQATHDGNTNELDVELENTGSTTLKIDDLSVLVDGEIRVGSDLAKSINGSNSAELWLPGETLTVNVSNVDSGSRVKFVTGNGVARTTEDFGDST